MAARLRPGFRVRYRAELGDGMQENEIAHLFFGRLTQPLQPNPCEVTATALKPWDDLERTVAAEPAAHAFWLPLREAASGALDASYSYDPDGANMQLPCWRFEGETIWGLTFKMLQSLLGLVQGGTCD